MSNIRDMGMQKQSNEALYIGAGFRVGVCVCAQSVSPPDSVSAEYAVFGEYTE